MDSSTRAGSEFRDDVAHDILDGNGLLGKPGSIARGGEREQPFDQPDQRRHSDSNLLHGLSRGGLERFLREQVELGPNDGQRRLQLVRSVSGEVSGSVERGGQTSQKRGKCRPELSNFSAFIVARNDDGFRLVGSDLVQRMPEANERIERPSRSALTEEGGADGGHDRSDETREQEQRRTVSGAYRAGDDVKRSCLHRASAERRVANAPRFARPLPRNG